MKTKVFSGIFSLLGVILAVCTIFLSLTSLEAEPKLVRKAPTAAASAEAMLDALCRGDYETAGKWMYGSPSLGTGADSESETGRLLWEAFVKSLRYELVDDSYITQSGISQNVRIRALDLSAVTANLKDRSQTLLTQRVAEAEDVTQIYDESNNYKESFVMEVLRDATQEAIAQDAAYTTQEVTLDLVYENGQWWVVPSQNLMNVISGGIIG